MRIMETKTIPLEEYQEMVRQIKLIRQLGEIDIDLVKQFKDSLKDVKEGRIFELV